MVPAMTLEDVAAHRREWFDHGEFENGAPASSKRPGRASPATTTVPARCTSRARSSETSSGEEAQRLYAEGKRRLDELGAALDPDDQFEFDWLSGQLDKEG